MTKKLKPGILLTTTKPICNICGQEIRNLMVWDNDDPTIGCCLECYNKEVDDKK